MSTATDMPAAYLDAEAKVLRGQSTTINGRVITRANLAEIAAERKEWERRVAAEQRPLGRCPGKAGRRWVDRRWWMRLRLSTQRTVGTCNVLGT